MKVRIRGVYAAHRTLACGRRVTYFYHRKTGTRLPDDPTSLTFLQRVEALDRPPKPTVPDKSFKQLFQRYRKSTAYTDLAASTKAEYDRHIRYVEPAIGLFPVASFTRDHMDQITSKYTDKPSLAKAIRRTVSVMLGYAADILGWIPFNPIHGMEKKRKRTEEGQKPLTEPQIARFRARNPYGSRARLSFELGLATAFRREDQTKVLDEDIAAGIIPLLTNKAGVLVVVSVTRHLLRAHLAFREQNPQHASSRYALGAQRDGRPIHKRTLSGEFEVACDSAGFEKGQRIHALRYTAAARLFERNFSYDDIAQHTGHRMAAMARRYCEKRRKAAERGGILDSYDDELARPGETVDAPALTSSPSADSRALAARGGPADSTDQGSAAIAIERTPPGERVSRSSASAAEPERTVGQEFSDRPRNKPGSRSGPARRSYARERCS